MSRRQDAVLAKMVALKSNGRLDASLQRVSFLVALLAIVYGMAIALNVLTVAAIPGLSVALKSVLTVIILALGASIAISGWRAHKEKEGSAYNSVVCVSLVLLFLMLRFGSATILQGPVEAIIFVIYLLVLLGLHFSARSARSMVAADVTWFTGKVRKTPDGNWDFRSRSERK